MSSPAASSPFSLGSYTAGIHDEWPDADIYRWIYTELFPDEPLKTRARQMLHSVLPPAATPQSRR